MPWIAKQIPNHWTIREVPACVFFRPHEQNEFWSQAQMRVSLWVQIFTEGVLFLCIFPFLPEWRQVLLSSCWEDPTLYRGGKTEFPTCLAHTFSPAPQHSVSTSRLWLTSYPLEKTLTCSYGIAFLVHSEFWRLSLLSHRSINALKLF